MKRNFAGQSRRAFAQASIPSLLHFGGAAESDFYLQRNGGSGVLRCNYAYAGGANARNIVDGTIVLNANTWYGIAVVADDTAGPLSLYVDSGSGYGLGLSGNLAISQSTLDWAFCRDYYNGDFDPTNGSMDHVQINDTALAIGDLRVIPEPATIGMIGLAGAGLLFVRRRFMM